MITMRMSSGRKQKARNGGYSGGKAAIGYQATRGDKRLKIDTDKMNTVKRVFELKKESPKITLQSIADVLNKEGYTTAQVKLFRLK